MNEKTGREPINNFLSEISLVKRLDWLIKANVPPEYLDALVQRARFSAANYLVQQCLKNANVADVATGIHIMQERFAPETLSFHSTALGVKKQLGEPYFLSAEGIHEGTTLTRIHRQNQVYCLRLLDFPAGSSSSCKELYEQVKKAYRNA